MKTFVLLFALMSSFSFTFTSADAQNASAGTIPAVVTETPSLDPQTNFAGTWKGKQYGRNGSWVFAEYRLWLKDGKLEGKAFYTNLQRGVRAEGYLYNFNPNGTTITFLVYYRGGFVDGTTGSFDLHLEGTTLKGNAKNLATGYEITVDLVRVP